MSIRCCIIVEYHNGAQLVLSLVSVPAGCNTNLASEVRHRGEIMRRVLPIAYEVKLWCYTHLCKSLFPLVTLGNLKPQFLSKNMPINIFYFVDTN